MISLQCWHLFEHHFELEFSLLIYVELSSYTLIPLMKTLDRSVETFGRKYSRPPQLTCELTHFRSCDLQWLTFIGHSTIMRSKMVYFYRLFNNHVIWNGLLLLAIQQSCDLKWFTFISHSTFMWSTMAYYYSPFNNHVIWNGIIYI